MNKIVNINLGGYPFVMDEDAYAYLSKYLKSIESHFRGFKGYENIIFDIESRIAELFEDKLDGSQIVHMEIVKETVTIMGQPEDFVSDDEMEDDSLEKNTHDSEKEKRDYNFRPGKRLFRDKENKIIGGVCSGLTAYFGLQDPIWIRLAFVLSSIGGGIGLIVYMILLVIIPKARTAADRLSMKGDPINVDNIAADIEEGIERLGEEFNKLNQKFKRKHRSKRRRRRF